MRHLAIVIFATLALSSGVAAAEPAQNAARIGVGYGATAYSCSVHTDVSDLARAFYGGTNASLQAAIDDVLSCAELQKLGLSEYSVVMFLAKPTAAATELTIVHVLHRSKNADFGSTTLPGVKAINWIYITDNSDDRIVTQATITPSSNPIVAQVGGLLGALEKPLEKSQGPPIATPLQVWVAPSVPLMFKRGTIAANDYVSTKVGKQIAGTFALTNTPATWITANAVAGLTIGDMTGSQRVKLDNKLYTSDPLSVGLTAAGVTLHLPYDALSANPSAREIFGLFLGGTITPAGGLAAGLSIGWRGVAFVWGRAWFRVQTMPADKVLGDAAPTGGAAQFTYDVTKSWFVGGSYAFSK